MLHDLYAVSFHWIALRKSNRSFVRLCNTNRLALLDCFNRSLIIFDWLMWIYSLLICRNLRSIRCGNWCTEFRSIIFSEFFSYKSNSSVSCSAWYHLTTLSRWFEMTFSPWDHLRVFLYLVVTVFRMPNSGSAIVRVLASITSSFMMIISRINPLLWIEMLN